MWHKIGMIGRDKFLQKEIYPRCQGKLPPFLLSGPRGVGKTAILEWAFENGKEPKAYISCTWSLKECFTAIIEGWKITSFLSGGEMVPINSKSKAPDLEKAIFQQAEGAIYIDDIQQATPGFLRRFKVWRERFQVYASGVPPFRKEELKRCLWGLKEIDLLPIDKEHRETLAGKACQAYGSALSPREIAQNSRGYPGRILSMAKGIVDIAPVRVKGEEIDLSPILLIGLGCIVALRYIGRGMDDTTLYMMGGIGMIFAFAARMFISKGSKSE